jgi:hypothetical protein
MLIAVEMASGTGLAVSNGFRRYWDLGHGLFANAVCEIW